MRERYIGITLRFICDLTKIDMPVTSSFLKGVRVSAGLRGMSPFELCSLVAAKPASSVVTVLNGELPNASESMKRVD